MASSAARFVAASTILIPQHHRVLPQLRPPDRHASNHLVRVLPRPAPFAPLPSSRRLCAARTFFASSLALPAVPRPSRPRASTAIASDASAIARHLALPSRLFPLQRRALDALRVLDAIRRRRAVVLLAHGGAFVASFRRVVRSRRSPSLVRSFARSLVRSRRSLASPVASSARRGLRATRV